MPICRWIGASATIICIVVQFGLAIRPECSDAASGFTSATTSGHVGVHAPEAGVVDDDGARLDDLWRPLGGDGAAGRAEDDVQPLDRLVGDLHHLDLARAERDPLAGRAAGRERNELGDREVPLGEHLEDGRADGARGAQALRLDSS